MRRVVIAACLLLACSGTTSDGGTAPGPTTPPMAGLFTSAVREVVVEVDYQPGAEPYTGSTLATGDTWDLFRANFEKLFEAAPRKLTFPTQLSQMERLADVSGTDFSADAILAIASKHRNERSTNERRTFYVVFLKGFFSKDGARQTSTLGVSLGDTGVIAMFKPVIESTGAGLGTTERFVEQTTLVHEVGHAVGLVNRGVPISRAHHDAEHGAHCSNKDCVMYWLNEGADLASFVARRVTGGKTIVFDDDCLADVRAAAR